MANIETVKNGKTFATWKRDVDYNLVKLCGMCSDDIPDWMYHAAWSNGVTPIRAAQQALEAAGLY